MLVRIEVFRNILAMVASLSATIALLSLQGCNRSQKPLPVTPAAPPQASAPPPQATAPTDPRFASLVEAMKSNDYPQALKLCREARTKKYPLAQILAYEADIFRGVGYLDKQMETLKTWAQVAPKEPRPLYALFYLYLDVGWKQEAEDVSKKAFQIAPNEARTWVTKALLAYRSTEPIQAIPAIQKARQLAPDDIQYANLHANILLKAFKPEEAEKVLREALQKEPKNFINRLALAQALVRAKKTAEASSLLQTLAKEEPNHAEVPYELGVLAYQQENYPEALRQFQSAVQIERTYSNALWYLGRTEIKQNLKSQGEQHLKEYQQLNAKTDAFETALARLKAQPKSPEAHFQAGLLQLEAEDFPRAIVEFRQALQLKPRDVKIKQTLADALSRHGRKTEAQQITNP